MFETSNFSPADDADEWATRSEHWMTEAAQSQKRRNKRQRNPNPLILCGHGASLRVDQGALVIRDGFSHYPQDQARYRYFPGSKDIPERIVLLDGSGTLSFEVLSWLSEQGVALIRVRWTGDVAIAISGSGFAADREQVAWQHEVRSDEAKRCAFATGLIARKLTASIQTLKNHVPETPARAVAIAKLSETSARLQAGQIDNLISVRSYEGECAAAYFAAWTAIALDWKATTRYPVPDEWRGFTSRSSLANGAKPKNYNASHPINAMLNYAYAVKMAHVQIGAIADGYDPMIGIMHHGRGDKPAFIFDLIEPERPNVDAAVLSFAQSREFSGADFILRKDGGCRLSPQLARTVATIVAN